MALFHCSEPFLSHYFVIGFADDLVMCIGHSCSELVGTNQPGKDYKDVVFVLFTGSISHTNIPDEIGMFN